MSTNDYKVQIFFNPIRKVCKYEKSRHGALFLNSTQEKLQTMLHPVVLHSIMNLGQVRVMKKNKIKMILF
jgi:hypothetical protein